MFLGCRHFLRCGSLSGFASCGLWRGYLWAWAPAEDCGNLPALQRSQAVGTVEGQGLSVGIVLG